VHACPLPNCNPSPMFVLQVTNTGVRRPGYKAMTDGFTSPLPTPSIGSPFSVLMRVSSPIAVHDMLCISELTSLWCMCYNLLIPCCCHEVQCTVYVCSKLVTLCRKRMRAIRGAAQGDRPVPQKAVCSDHTFFLPLQTSGP